MRKVKKLSQERGWLYVSIFDMLVYLQERSSGSGMLPGREENGEILENEITNTKAKSFHGWEMVGFWAWAEVSALY